VAEYIGSSTYFLDLQANSFLVTFTINSWPFAVGSKGLRIRVLAQDRAGTVNQFYLEPGCDRVIGVLNFKQEML
jgi:hypothetical protein